MIRIAALASVLALASGWLLYANVYGSGGARQVRWRDLTARLGVVEFLRPTAHIYRSRARLERFLARTMPGRAPRLPEIDFRRREALLVATGPRSSSGYALDVVSITERRRAIDVRLRERTPALGSPAAARLGFPYRLLTIPLSAKSVHTHVEGRP